MISFIQVLRHKTLLLCIVLLTPFSTALGQTESKAPVNKRLYVATPGIRDYLEYGGHGLLIFDIDSGHKFIKRIPTGGVDANGKPINVKGIVASVSLHRIYVSTIKTMMAIDLETEKLVWEKAYVGGCDRMAISPDGKTIYVPSFESDHWNVVDANSGEVIARFEPKSGAHNTVFGADGKSVYCAGLRSPNLTIADTTSHKIARTAGPFSAGIRPFTVNGKQTLCFVNVNELLGFEIGDLVTGQKIHRVEVSGFEKGPVKRHGCPSHGIGLTPDEKEVWVCDAFNQKLHIFDATVMPPKQIANISVRDQPGWITFSLDGHWAYPSTGEIINVKTRTIETSLAEEKGLPVHSEKVIEIHFQNNHPIAIGDQFGLGRVGTP